MWCEAVFSDLCPLFFSPESFILQYTNRLLTPSLFNAVQSNVGDFGKEFLPRILPQQFESTVLNSSKVCIMNFLLELVKINST